MYKFRVVGIPYGRNLALSAKKLETLMNKFSKENYDIQVNDLKQGWCVVARKDDAAEASNPLAVLEQKLREAGFKSIILGGPPGAREEPEEWSRRTNELLNRVGESTMDASTVELFTAAVAKSMPTLIKGFSYEELNLAAKEMEECSRERRGR